MEEEEEEKENNSAAKGLLPDGCKHVERQPKCTCVLLQFTKQMYLGATKLDVFYGSLHIIARHLHMERVNSVQ